jgi:hypothetical protein
MKKYTQGDEDGFTYKTIAGVKLSATEKKTATGYGKIDFTIYTCIRHNSQVY